MLFTNIISHYARTLIYSHVLGVAVVVRVIGAITMGTRGGRVSPNFSPGGLSNVWQSGIAVTSYAIFGPSNFFQPWLRRWSQVRTKKVVRWLVVLEAGDMLLVLIYTLVQRLFIRRFLSYERRLLVATKLK